MLVLKFDGHFPALLNFNLIYQTLYLAVVSLMETSSATPVVAMPVASVQ